MFGLSTMTKITATNDKSLCNLNKKCGVMVLIQGLGFREQNTDLHFASRSIHQ